MTEYQKGQRDAIAVAMTVICPHCHSGFYRSTAQNDIVRDGLWHLGDMTTGFHSIAGKKRRCRAMKLIPLYRIIR